jgi:hypothetical protein
MPGWDWSKLLMLGDVVVSCYSWQQETTTSPSISSFGCSYVSLRACVRATPAHLPTLYQPQTWARAGSARGGAHGGISARH